MVFNDLDVNLGNVTTFVNVSFIPTARLYRPLGFTPIGAIPQGCQARWQPVPLSHG